MASSRILARSDGQPAIVARWRRPRVWLGAGLLLVLVGLAGWWLDVPSRPTRADRVAIAEMLRRAGYGDLADFPKPEGFAAELATARAVQDAVLAAAPIDRGIAEGRRREPADLLRRGFGLCYDRSRAIEKALDLFGLTTRHASLYGTEGIGKWQALVTPGDASHAVTELLTERGWMTIDSNARWIGLTADGRPLSVPEIDPKTAAEVAPAEAREPPTWLLVEPHVTVYGLYSRHGDFYPPFVPFPDVDFWQLLRYTVF